MALGKDYHQLPMFGEPPTVPVRADVGGVVREVVVYRGRAYVRYPESANRSLRAYFSCTYSRGGGERQRHFLHRDLWEDVYGPIPPKHHVHHINEDPLDNRLENLACKSGRDHLSDHGHAPWRQELSRQQAERMRPLTKEWHGSEEGRAWHREHGRDVHESMPLVTLTCAQCGTLFQTKQLRATYALFCSNACKSAARRASGVDDEDRACIVCGTMFRINRYRKTLTCSVACARALTDQPIEKICEECGTLYQGSPRYGRFCSRSCGWQSWRRRRNDGQH
jgi:hypothetical protein